jgi:transposase
MKSEEEVVPLRAENQALRDQFAQRDELIAQLLKRVPTPEEHLSKDSNKSHQPPSSDRFTRQVKSLRKKVERNQKGKRGIEARP